MGKFLITEIEKKRILGLYGLLKEDIDPNSGGTITINNVYQAGYYTTNAIDQVTKKTISEQLNEQLLKVRDFVIKFPNSIVSVSFSSQESSIPNTDNEKSGYFENNKDNRLQVGELSKARRDFINSYIQKYFQDLKDSGVIQPSVEIPPVTYNFKNPQKIFMGSKEETPWCIKGDPQIPSDDTQGFACTGKNYKVDGTTTKNWFNQKGKLYKADYDTFVKEQNSTIEITVIPKTTTTQTTPPPKKNPSCAVGLKIRVYVPYHRCQNAEFFILANNTLLYNSQGGMTANLNTADEKRGVPNRDSTPKYSKKVLNPGFGLLPNGDGTIGDYTYGTYNEEGDLGGGRSDTFVVTEEQSKKIVQEGNGYINIWLIATTQVAHRDKPIVTITKNINGVETIVYNDTPKVNKGKILTLDECGEKVVNQDNGQLIPAVTTYLNSLLLQKKTISRDNVSPNDVLGEKDDNKEPYLTKSATLLSSGETLMNQILSTGGTTGKTLSQQLITSYYQPLVTSINTEPNFARDNRQRYVNKILRDDLYEDVRMDLSIFYSIFDAIYKQKVSGGDYRRGDYNPNGKVNENGGLDYNQIRTDLREIKSQSMVRD